MVLLQKIELLVLDSVRKGAKRLTKQDKEKTFRKIKYLVESNNTSFYKVAKDLELSNVIFTDWKNGRSLPNAEKMVKIAKYFGVTVAYLIDTEDLV